MTIREKTKQIARSLSDKTYSEAFVAAEIATTIPFQIRAMRKERNWTQAMLAAKTGQHQETISDFENQDGGSQKIESLRRIAAAFDVGLIVRFAPFSELVDWSVHMSRKSHFVPSRTKDTKLRAQQSGVSSSAQALTYVQSTLDFSKSGTSSPLLKMADWKAKAMKQQTVGSGAGTSASKTAVSADATASRFVVND